MTSMMRMEQLAKNRKGDPGIATARPIFGGESATRCGRRIV
jgi:hypothetical protein